jgi:hypothetical protein
MGRMKDFIMKISEEMGHDGDINDEVLEKAQIRLANLAYKKEKKEKTTEDMLVEFEEKK